VIARDEAVGKAGALMAGLAAGESVTLAGRDGAVPGGARPRIQYPDGQI
jgi:hypothetical protein